MNECTPTIEEAFVRYRKSIWKLCLRMTRSADLADDLTQDVFMQLQRKIHTFNGDSQFYTWLYRLAINVVLMHLRKKRVLVTSLEGLEEQTREDGGTAYWDAVRIRDGIIESSPERISIERAVNSLPHGYRTVLILHDIEGLEHEEIADILGCEIGNSKSQLFKARIKVAAILQGDEKNRVERKLDSAFSELEKYLLPDTEEEK